MSESVKETNWGTQTSGLWVDGNWIEAVKFTASSSYNLTAVTVLLYLDYGPGTFILNIYSKGLDGKPDTILASKNFSSALLTQGVYQELKITLDSPLALTSGTDYFIGIDTSDSIQLAWGYKEESPIYQCYTYAKNNPPWADAANDDLLFKVWGEDTAYSGDIVGWWETVGGKLAPRWRDPLENTIKTGVCGITGGKIYPICDDDIGGHSAPINGVVTAEMRPKITV